MLSFSTVLIANRGEIACRLIRSCQSLNLKTVAVYSDADVSAKHVSLADKSVWIGPSKASESYLNQKAIIKACKETGATAVLPGYGFLSTSPEFAKKCKENNILFIGPTIDNLSCFALKHEARKLAAKLNIPIPPGSFILKDIETAISQAETIGYPVIIKSVAGGGGIGMHTCFTKQDLKTAFEQVVHLSSTSFGNGDVYIEKYFPSSRHVEIQVFGDKQGKILCLGERECSIQRRYQKLIEETPSPFITDLLRQEMFKVAKRLCEHIKYKSSGTVEFLVDPSNGSFYFLEVNPRLQVEHTVTESVTGIDIVAWMLRLDGDDETFQAEFDNYIHKPSGHAIECRIYAEDPANKFRPSVGIITSVLLPPYQWVRYDGWVTSGTEVSQFYDSLLVKVIVRGDARKQALDRITNVLSNMQLSGLQTNKDYLLKICQSDAFKKGNTTTRFCDDFQYTAPCLEVVKAGLFSSLQNWPGRVGFWNIGVPPSGPMDSLSLRIANKLVGNEETACGIEMTLDGMTVKVHQPCTIAITGAPCTILCNSTPIAQYKAITLKEGDIVCVGKCTGNGIRIYLSVAGGFEVPKYLGSCSTFPLGKFGGFQGRILATGDMLPLNTHSLHTHDAQLTTESVRFSSEWCIGVIYGPHGAPDFFTKEYIELLWKSTWKVHHNSNRLGVRLTGPKPVWARKDGGNAGLHPSNIHDCEYAIGSINFTGDHPVILGVDGPSLGGFVCPITIVQAELWKIGQVKPGDTIKFVRLTHKQAHQLRLEQNCIVKGIGSETRNNILIDSKLSVGREEFKFDAILEIVPKTSSMPSITVRAQGDSNVLVEYGENILDIDLRLCVWMFMEWIEKYKNTNPDCGLLEISPGVRSVQVQYDSLSISSSDVLAILRQCRFILNTKLVIPCRKLKLPLAFNDKWCQDAVRRYVETGNSSAPYVPSNIEFVARINGLHSGQEVLDLILKSTYLVMGLGDVYLNAPCAIPINPLHRLVTSKYNPSRTFTPEGAVGLGGAYMCIYGMESPGGYQLVGRTIPIWKTYALKPNLFNFFDKIQFFLVSDDRLTNICNSYQAGGFELDIKDDVFDVAEYHQLLKDKEEEIEIFRENQKRAFYAELKRWNAADILGCESDSNPPNEVSYELLAPYNKSVNAPIVGSVWKILVKKGDIVHNNQIVAILESMKMEFEVRSDFDGRIKTVVKQTGQVVHQGSAIFILETVESSKL